MSFTRTWQEANPNDDNFGYELDDYQRQTRQDVRERLAVQHKAYLDESGHSDVGEHKPGECTILHVGAKSSFPTPATTTSGCIAIATDEGNQVYYWNGSGWVKQQEPVLITGNQTIAGTKTFSDAPVMSKGLTVGQDTDIGNYNFRAKTLESDQATGTAPLTVASTTKTENLNADLIDDKHGDAMFGAWAAKTVNVVYEAESDGYVIAYHNGTGVSADIIGYTDGNNPPTTIRGGCSWQGIASSPLYMNAMPVKKGDFWKAAYSGGGSVTVYWLPSGA